MKRILNPILPSWEYVADGEPHIFGDRVYLFGSHDAFNGKSFCPLDYVLWSAPINDLSDWRKEGVIYRTIQDPMAKKNSFMQAPDVIEGPDGRFYLYYTLSLDPTMSVAVSDTITGPYEYYGRVKDITGHVIGSSKGDLFQFDPGLFRDDDGRIYLYKHYLITSGTTGYLPNPSEVAVGDSWHGPYTVLGDPHPTDPSRTSFHSQISSVFKVPGKKDLYIAVADRWAVQKMDLPYPFYEKLFTYVFTGRTEEIPALAQEFHLTQKQMSMMSDQSTDTSIADYVWLPLRFVDPCDAYPNGMVLIDWLDEWRIEDYD